MTTKLSDLREALDVWIPEYVEVLSRRDDMLMEPLEEVVAAVRRFLALTETGIRVEWCEPHEALANPTADYCGKSLYLSDAGVPDSKIGPCHIVPKILADYLTEEET